MIGHLCHQAMVPSCTLKDIKGWKVRITRRASKMHRIDMDLPWFPICSPWQINIEWFLFDGFRRFNVSMVLVLYETGTFLWVIPLQWEEKMLETREKMSRIPEVQKDIWPWQRSATKGPFAPSLIWWLPSGSGERWSPSFHISFKYYL